MKIVDSFLSEEEFSVVRDNLVFNTGFPFFLHHGVTKQGDFNSHWFGAHVVYDQGVPISDVYDEIGNIFFPYLNMKSLLRIKINFYPHTHKVIEHASHVDYDFSHTAAIFSLNTCDGYTKIGNDAIVDSVENRMVFFDGSNQHRSTTTSNQSGRFNIAFNYL